MLMSISQSLNSSQTQKKSFIIEVMGLFAIFITEEQLAIPF